MTESEYKLREYCNNNYDIRELYEDIMGRKPGNGKVFCPCHHNVNTPAAKIYDNALKCFGECNRMFYPYDLLKRFYPDELEQIRKTVIVPEVSKTFKPLKSIMHRSDLDLNKPVYEVIKFILDGYEKTNI